MTIPSKPTESMLSSLVVAFFPANELPTRMVTSNWPAALLVASALGAGVALGCYLRTTRDLLDNGGGDPLIKELEQEIERQKRLRAQERAGRTNAERVPSFVSIGLHCEATASSLVRVRRYANV